MKKEIIFINRIPPNPLMFPEHLNRTIFIEGCDIKRPRRIKTIKEIKKKYLDDSESDPDEVKEVKNILRNKEKNKKYFEEEAECTDDDIESDYTEEIESGEEEEEDDFIDNDGFYYFEK